MPLNMRNRSSFIKFIKDNLVMMLDIAEVEIMRIVWQDERTTVRKVHRKLSQHRDIAYTNVMVAMSRLAEKGVLNRYRDGLAYVYTPAFTEDDFVIMVVQQALEGLLDDYSKTMVDYVIDYLGHNPSELHRLQKTLRSNIVASSEEDEGPQTLNNTSILSSLQDMLENVGSQQAEILQLCAIPRWFDIGILSVLQNCADGNEQVLQSLLTYSFVRQLDWSTYTYHDEVRAALLTQWHKERRIDENSIHLRLVDYFDEFIKIYLRQDLTATFLDTTIPRLWKRWAHEGIYHRLMADPIGRFDELKQAIKYAETSNRWAEAEGLLQIAIDVAVDQNVLLSVDQLWTDFKLYEGKNSIDMNPSSDDLGVIRRMVEYIHVIIIHSSSQNRSKKDDFPRLTVNSGRNQIGSQV